MEKTLEYIENAECKLACALYQALGDGLDKVSTDEAGKVTDMIKDLAEAKEKCMKAWYYQSMTEGMMEEDNGYNERMGYPRTLPRRTSSGRFKPGYMPPMLDDIPDHMVNPGRWGEKGRPYDEFQDARRHYTETRSQADKSRMDEKAKEHVTSSMASIKEIWTDADPQLRMQLKADLTRMVNDLTV